MTGYFRRSDHVEYAVDVPNKQKAQATARLADLDLPPPEMPLELRILVARALVAADDKRARP